MTRGNKAYIERCKDFLIVLLIISAVWLGGTTLSTGTWSGEASNNAPDSAGEVADYGMAARPLAIAVSEVSRSENENGGGVERHAVKYDEAAADALFTLLSAPLREALGTAGAPERVGLEEFLIALSGEGVYFDFVFELPMETISRLLGVSVSGETASHNVRRILLARDGAGTALYYTDADYGYVYRADTALQYKSWLTEFRAGGSFAFEMGEDYSSIDPAYLFLSELPEISGITVTNPVGTLDMAQILAAFEMSGYVASSYTDTDGSVVYVEGDKTLRVSPGGEAHFKRSAPETNPDELGFTDEGRSAAFAAAMESVGAYCGDARLMLSGVDYGEDGGCTAYFDYVLGDVQIVVYEPSHAAEIELNGGVIVSAELYFRDYRADGTQKPIPEILSAAIVTSGGGGEPRLVYEDLGGSAELSWVVR